MNIIEVDVRNLQRWFANTLCTAPTSCPSGALALNNSGYILYFSDRRGNNTDTTHQLIGNVTGNETGEYGNEDTINPASSTGTPNTVRDAPEDINANGVLDTYGATPHPIAVDSSTGSPWPDFMDSMPATNPAFKRISSVATWMAAPTPSAGTGTAGLLTQGTPYYYVVTATGTSSGETSGTEAAPFTATGTKKIKLTWTAYSGATGYRVYRGISAGGESGYISVSGGSTTTYTDSGAGLTSSPVPGPVAQKNSVVIFRRALRLVNGTLGNLPPLPAATCTAGAAGGFTVAAENPIYVQGDYNASVANSFSDTATLCHVPAAVIADAVTLLSNAFVDSISFNNPTNAGNRNATTTWYRMAIIGGKNNSFTRPTFSPAPPQDFGTDGGTHNFLRYIENWSSAVLNYRGSMCSFYISRQATGVYKCCSTVYSPPSRAYAFDTDFQNIGKLPPGTPRFTDVNALSFQQAILSTQ
jgi:hypothetical protein